MHDHLLEMTSRSLVKLELCADRLDALLVPSTAASGTNAGKPPSRRGSKPPLSVAMLDLKVGATEVLAFWGGRLVRDYPGEMEQPGRRDLSGWAAWVRVHLPEMEEMVWAETAAEQIISCARQVADVVDPPAAASDPLPIQVGTAREVASWCANLGAKVSRWKIQQWIDSGEVRHERLPDGRVMVELEAVLSAARVRER